MTTARLVLASRSRADGAVRLRTMAFGQPSGPPASGGQLRELLTLLNEAGHATFREARGSMGFTQRQAGGRFTRDEAAGFIDRLQDAECTGEVVDVTPAARLSATDQLLRRMTAEQLAAELERRGWTVAKP